MKVKDHRQMMRSLTDPLNIPKLRALIEANPVLTQEEFKARQAQLLPEEWDDLTPREELYYQQGPFSTHEDFRGAKGGTVPGRLGYEEGGAADDFDGQRTYTDKKTGKRYRTEEFKAHLRSKTSGRSYKYPDYEGTKFIKVDGKNVKTKEYQTFLYEKDKAAGRYKDRWKNLPEDVKKERIQKSLDWQKTDEGKKIRSQRHKKRILEKNPLSKVDQSVLKDFEINLKYLKHINEIIKENGGVRPNPETLSDLIEIRVETDPDLQKLLGNKSFSTKNLSPSSFRNKYNRAMAGTKRVTADNFKNAITDLFETELKGSGTSFDDFIKNDFKLTETFLVDQADSPSAKYQRRYKSISVSYTHLTLPTNREV